MRGRLTNNPQRTAPRSSSSGLRQEDARSTESAEEPARSSNDWPADTSSSNDWPADTSSSNGWPADTSPSHSDYPTQDRDAPSYGGQRSEGGPRNCYICKEPGHFARDCPTSGYNSRSSSRSQNEDVGYSENGRYGHNDRQYASRDKYGQNDRQYASRDKYGQNDRQYASRDKYGQSDHHQGFQTSHNRNDRYQDSRSAHDRNDRSYASQHEEKCENCGGRGHSERQCPSAPLNGNNNRGSSGYGSSQGPFSYGSDSRESTQETCYRCQETGHRAHMCPKRVGFNAKEETAQPYMHVVKLTEDEATSRNNTGINFSRYDDIQVKVSDSQYRETTAFERKKLRTFQDAKLCDELLEMLEKMKFITPTPVQRYAIPIVDEGNDIMACAQTGSGKTAAFILPIVNRLLQMNLRIESRKRPQKPYALILTPTRELTVQITKDALAYCFKTKICIKECYGGTHVGTQIQNILAGCHLLVGTLGRIKDFIEKGVISLSELRFLVLDEADRMLDMGFREDVVEILKHRDADGGGAVQTMMFSATFPEDVQNLARDFLRDDFYKLDVGVVGTVNADVSQTVVCVRVSEKKDSVIQLVLKDLEQNPRAKILIFVETKRSADFLAIVLSTLKVKATSIHGDRLQDQREKALYDFQKGDCPILVATSVAARGLDITGVSHVINYDLPSTIQDYVHRVGRTGRVGNKGRATSFYDPEKDFGIREALRDCISDGGECPPSFLM